jgi:integral membrane protein
MDDQSNASEPKIDVGFLTKLRTLSIVEGTSTLVLFFIAMPLKYMANMPKAVSIVGSLHGFLFVALGIMLLMAIKRIPISYGAAMMGFVAAIVPFGPFIYDRWLQRKVVQ